MKLKAIFVASVLAGISLSATAQVIVRDAFLGGNLNGQKSTDEISFTESTVSIKAIDEVRLYDNFRIGNNGNIKVECNNSVKTACSVGEGGSLKISAESVRLEKGFTVAKDGFLNITGIAE